MPVLAVCAIALWVAPNAMAAPPPTAGTSFLGVQGFDESSSARPDSMGSVGPSQVVVATNGRLKVFSKAGALQFDTDDNTFWSSVRNGQNVVYPQIEYDRLSGRWIMSAINAPASGPNRILIAVSSGPTIINASSFTFHQFQQDQTGATSGQTNGFAEYPQMGVDRFAVYIGADVFSQDFTANLGSTGFVIRKSDLLSGTLTVTAFRNLGSPGFAGPVNPQGVHNQDPTATEGYFIGVDGAVLNKLVIRRVSDPGSVAPTISGNLDVALPATSFPLDVPSMGTSDLLDAIDDRFFEAMIARDPGGQPRLWTSHAIAVNSSGTISGGNRDALRWYELGTLSGTPSVQQSGTVFDSAATNPAFYWIPSIAANGQGHAVIASSAAGATHFAEVAAAQRYAGEPAGTMSSPAILQGSVSAYELPTPSPQFWGAYSQTIVDPTDNMTFWTFQEYAVNTTKWGVRAIQIKAPPPATPSAASPSSVAAGQPSVGVAVTGTSTSGSGFFDPGPDAGGPGYANHISAAVSGGVIVNSVTYTDPTHVTLQLNTSAAAPGLRDLTITNPDGQSSSLVGALTVLPAPPAQPAPTVTPPAAATPTKRCKKKRKKRAAVAKKCKKKKKR